MNDYTKDRILNLLRFLTNEREISSTEYERLSNVFEEEHDWMTAKEVAKMLKVTPRTVENYVAEEVFKQYKIGKTCRYLKSEILESMGVE